MVGEPEDNDLGDNSPDNSHNGKIRDTEDKLSGDNDAWKTTSKEH